MQFRPSLYLYTLRDSLLYSDICVIVSFVSFSSVFVNEILIKKSRLASFIFAATLFLAVLYKPSQYFHLILELDDVVHLSVAILNENVSTTRNPRGNVVLLSTTDINIERKDDHILSISNIDLTCSKVQSTAFKPGVKSFTLKKFDLCILHKHVLVFVYFYDFFPNRMY